MSRKLGDTLPSHRSLFKNGVLDKLAYLFIFLMVIVAIIVFGIRMVVEHNCQDYYVQDSKILGYWFHLEVGSNKKECPQPYEKL